MTRLTEEMILARSSNSGELSSIKKLNLWGNDLSDVSIIKRMRGLEVLALSLNKITTLQPFEACVKLQELYLRKNNIQDIDEIRYLQNLPNLKYLWLEDNPCCNVLGGSEYRAIVLRALPNLKKLDNIEVTKKELMEAVNSVHEQPQQYDEEQNLNLQLHQPENRTLQHQPDRPLRQPDHPFHQPNRPQRQHNDLPYSARSHYNPRNTIEWDTNSNCQSQTSRNPVDNSSSLNSHHFNIGTARTVNTSSHRYDYMNCQPPVANLSDWTLNTHRSRLNDNRFSDSASTVIAAPFQRRHSSRRSNLLSAAICLVNELELSSLEVLEQTIQCRINELADE